MNFLEKVKLLIDKRYTSPFLKRHKDDYFCNRWWCHKVQISTIPLSEIKSNIKSIGIDEPKYRQIEYEILERGFDYSKSYIYLSSKKYITDGHHRYFILKKHFDDTLMITVYILTDMKNRYGYVLKVSLVHLFVWFYRTLFRREKGQIIELDM